jgi:ABC-2 family transporter protein
MSTSIIPQLVRKDFLMMRKTILIFCVAILASIVAICMIFGRVPNVVFFNLGITLLIAPAITCAIVLLMKTIVMEKQKSTQLFIMSLPVTVKEFTLSKLLLNLPIFTVFWLVMHSIFLLVAAYFLMALFHLSL